MNDKVFIIAEAGVNHNGSLDMALQLVDEAHAAGADAVKFQTFKSDAVISKAAPKAEYQKITTGEAESQYEMVRKLELSFDDHRRILAHCESIGILFLSTPFDAMSADFLALEMGVPLLKIPSGEITNAPLLLHIAQLQLPVIVSTGMSTLTDVEVALGVLAFGYLNGTNRPGNIAFENAYNSGEGQSLIREKVSLLHCTTEYPAPYDQTNLRAIDTLSTAFRLPIGLSDHTPGIVIPIAAVARGARIIEKHFTMDRNLPGPDHHASLQPDELAAMVEGIRQVEVAFGDGVKRPAPAELGNKNVARRSLVAANAVKLGEIWGEGNLTCKRPGNGIQPNLYWQFLGQRAERDYEADELIEFGAIE